MSKKCFKNSKYVREMLPERIELFGLPILKSGDLNFKACTSKFLIVLLFCYNILFYFNLYSSLAVTNRLCIYIYIYIYIYIIINIEKLKIKALRLLYSSDS